MQRPNFVLGVFLFMGLTVKAQTVTPKSAGLVKSAIAVTQTREQVLLTLAAAGASAEDLREISEDLGATEKLPKLSLEKDELLIGGARSGMTYTSYAPVKVKLRGQVWAYEAKHSVGENYRAFKRAFLESKHAGGFWLPAAEAQSKTEILHSDINKGLVVGSVVGGAMGLGGGTVATAAIGAAIGGTVGMAWGLVDATWASRTGPARADLVNALLKSPVLITCTEREVSLRPAGTAGTKPEVKISAQGIQLLDLNGKEASSSITPEQTQLLQQIAVECHNPQEAERLMASLKTMRNW